MSLRAKFILIGLVAALAIHLGELEGWLGAGVIILIVLLEPSGPSGLLTDEAKKLMTHFNIARLVAAASLLLATLSLPYGYYTLMRWIVCAVAGYGAVRANERKLPGWVWVFGGLAVVFNPIVPLGFRRADWAVIDVVGAAVMLASFTSSRLGKP